MQLSMQDGRMYMTRLYLPATCFASLFTIASE